MSGFKNATTAIEIIAIPPMTPPAMGPTWLSEFEVLGDGGFEPDGFESGGFEPDRDGPLGPNLVPGPYSGVSISDGCETVIRNRKGKKRAMMLTTCFKCFAGVPFIVLLLRPSVM